MKAETNELIEICANQAAILQKLAILALASNNASFGPPTLQPDGKRGYPESVMKSRDVMALVMDAPKFREMPDHLKQRIIEVRKEKFGIV